LTTFEGFEISLKFVIPKTIFSLKNKHIAQLSRGWVDFRKDIFGNVIASRIEGYQPRPG